MTDSNKTDLFVYIDNEIKAQIGFHQPIAISVTLVFPSVYAEKNTESDVNNDLKQFENLREKFIETLNTKEDPLNALIKSITPVYDNHNGSYTFQATLDGYEFDRLKLNPKEKEEKIKELRSFIAKTIQEVCNNMAKKKASDIQPELAKTDVNVNLSPQPPKPLGVGDATFNTTAGHTSVLYTLK